MGCDTFSDLLTEPLLQSWIPKIARLSLHSHIVSVANKLQEVLVKVSTGAI